MQRKQRHNSAIGYSESFFVVTSPRPDSVCEGIWILMSWSLPAVEPHNLQRVSLLGGMLSCQMIVSNGWELQLGDIRGAFLEADALDRKKGSLSSSLPPGGSQECRMER